MHFFQRHKSTSGDLNNVGVTLQQQQKKKKKELKLMCSFDVTISRTPNTKTDLPA